MDHLTGGCMLYYDLKPGEELPHAKIYIPVRHWAEDDGEVARGVQRFLDEVRGHGQQNGEHGCATGCSIGANGGTHGYSPSAFGNINIVNSTSYPEILAQAFPEDSASATSTFDHQQQASMRYHEYPCEPPSPLGFQQPHPRPRGLRQNWICLGSKADGSFTVTTYLSPLLFARQ